MPTTAPAPAPVPQLLDRTPPHQGRKALPQRRNLAIRLLRDPADSPAWVRPAVLALLIGTALLYLWNLSASGYSNSFYAAAVQAGTKSWKAWFFGSLDAGN